MNWHRILGLLLTDFFAGSPYVVELEKDLSLKKQFLDVVILRKGQGRFTRPLPDGLDNLATHNLVTFKSHWEALTDWPLKELTGHYVNYRKQVSPSLDSLLPEEEFRLYAISSRFPQSLAAAVGLKPVQQGVYLCQRGTDGIRIIVANELRRTENNALLHLLSAAPEQVAYGATHYEQRSADTSTLLGALLKSYQQEGLLMPYTMEDFRLDCARDWVQELTPEERVKGLSPKDLLQVLSPKDLVKVLSPEERLEGLSPAQIEEYLKRRKQKRPSRKQKKNGKN